MGEFYEPYYGFEPEDSGLREVRPYRDYIGLYIDDLIKVETDGRERILESYTHTDNKTDGDDILSEEYDEFILRDMMFAKEDAYELIGEDADDIFGIDIGEPGLYRIKGYATLVYRVGGIQEDTSTGSEYYDSDLYFEDANVKFLPKESFVEKLQVEKLA